MAEHAWTVLCQKVLVDTESQLFTLVDVYDRLMVNPSPEVPDIEAKLAEVRKQGESGVTLPARIRVVTQWMRSDMSQPETSKCLISLEDPLGQRIFGQEIPIELTESTLQRITLRSNTISVTALGYYWFIVEKPGRSDGRQPQWTEVARIPLQVTTTKGAEDAEARASFPTEPEPPSVPTPAAPRKSASRRGRGRP